MAAVAVRPVAGGVPRRAAAPVPSPAACGKKRPRVAPARRDSLTVGGEMSSQELLKKRLASELDVLHGLLKKAELISRGACKGGRAPTAGKKEQVLVSKPPRSKPIDHAGAGCTPSVKRRKISALVEQKPKPKQRETRVPRMSQEERNQLVARMSSLSGEVPAYIAGFLQKQFGDADAHGESEIEINFDAVQDSVLFELKTRLDKFMASKQRSKPVEDGANTTSTKKRKISTLVLEQKPEQKHGKVAEECKDDGKVADESKEKDGKVAEESKDGKLVVEESKGDKLPEESKDGKVAEESKDDDEVTDTSEQTPSKPVPFVVSPEEMKAQAVKCAAARAIYMPGLIYRANMRRELMEMESALALLPAESTIHPQELQGLHIKEYGRPSIMRHIGLVLKPDAKEAET